MPPTYQNGNVRATCPDCGALSSFEHRESKAEFGNLTINGNHTFDGKVYGRTLYILMRCAGCGRGGIAKVHDTGNQHGGRLEWFFPTSVERARIPDGLPPGIQQEFREAELCASISAWRAASGLLRSTLEKILRANGYVKGSLAARIDEVCADGLITDSRRKRAHDEVRVLGNDVLHDEWRAVTQEEVDIAHHYVQRIAEDFYDDRPSVEAILKAKGRLT